MIACLDTSTGICKLTLVDGNAHVGYEWSADRELARGLHAFVRDCLAEQGKAWSDLTGLIVYRGPGSYTGLRIGITVWNTLADTLAIPIIGVTGDDWVQSGLDRFLNQENDELVLPEYGGEANITKPRK